MEALIDLFWSKYADLRQAVDCNDADATAAIESELDPLVLAIFSSQSKDAASIQAQFRFALDLLNEEADDGGCVRRNGHLLRMLVERYLVQDREGLSANRLPTPDNSDSSAIADATVDGFLDDAILNRISERVIVIAPGYRIFYSNETNARRFEKPRDELIGKHIAEFIGIPRFKNEFKGNLDRCFTGESISLTYADQMNGETVVIRCRMSPFLSGSSQLIGALLVMQESADRRRRSAA